MPISGNLLSEENEGLETGTAPWAYVNDAFVTSVAQSSAQAYTGTKSALVVLAGGGSAEWITDAANAVAVSGSTAYTLSVRMRARDAARLLGVQLNEFTGGFAFLASTQGGAGTAGSTVNVPTSGWTSVYLTITTQPTTGLLAVGPLFAGAGQNNSGEGVYVDFICVRTSATIPAAGAAVTGVAVGTWGGWSGTGAGRSAGRGVAVGAWGGWAGIATDGLTPPPPSVIPVATITADDYLDVPANLGLINVTFRFEVLDYNTLAPIGELHPIRVPARATASTTGKYMRTLLGLELGRDDEATIDERAHLLRPSMTILGVDYPFGVFMFDDAPRDRYEHGLHLVGSLVDQGPRLEEARLSAWSIPAGSDLRYHTVALLDELGIVNYDVDTTDRTNGASVTFPPVTEYRELLAKLHALAGWWPPHFTLPGVYRARTIPAEGSVAYDHIYSLRGPNGRVKRGAVQERNNLPGAPNRYVVRSSSPSGVPVVGVWDVPDDAIHSAHNVGRTITKLFDESGHESVLTAYLRARELGLQWSRVQTVRFVGALDPRHELFDRTFYEEELYDELDQDLVIEPGGDHTHVLSLVF